MFRLPETSVADLTVFHLAAALVLSAWLAGGTGPANAQFSRTHEQGKLRGFHGPTQMRGITRSFQSDQEAKGEFQRILAAVGLSGISDRIELRATAETDNAAAGIDAKGMRFIFYNAAFMQELRARTANHWSLVSILAHEVGHHIRFHTEVDGRWHEFELEADYFSGFVLRRLGATLAQAQEAIRKISPAKATTTHPGLADRLQAITIGWSDGAPGGTLNGTRQQSSQQPQPSTNAEPVTVQIGADNVDDVLEVFLNETPVAGCEWQALNACAIDATQTLSGQHKIRFKLTNRVYTGFCLSPPCGRWSANMRISAKGRTLWSMSVGQRDNSPGVKFDKTLDCDFDRMVCE